MKARVLIATRTYRIVRNRWGGIDVGPRPGAGEDALGELVQEFPGGKTS